MYEYMTATSESALSKRVNVVIFRSISDNRDFSYKKKICPFFKPVPDDFKCV